MSIADKLTTIAENEQKVYEAGEKKHTSRYATAFVVGDGTKNISFDCPFEPDYIVVQYHGADASSATASLTAMQFDRRSFAVNGGFYSVRLTSKNYIGTVGSATGKTYFKWADGICEVIIPSTLNVTYIDGCQYICIAVKYTDKGDRELLEEEVRLLADTGDTVEYSKTRVNDTVTDAEWQTLIATKPNRTFTLK